MCGFSPDHLSYRELLFFKQQFSFSGNGMDLGSCRCCCTCGALLYAMTRMGHSATMMVVKRRTIFADDRRPL